MQQLLFGAASPLIADGRVVTIEALGGTGALKVGADFLKRLLPAATVFISDPSWENHLALFESAGFPVQSYPYYDAETRGVNFAAMKAKLAEGKRYGALKSQNFRKTSHSFLIIDANPYLRTISAVFDTPTGRPVRAVDAIAKVLGTTPSGLAAKLVGKTFGIRLPRGQPRKVSLRRLVDAHLDGGNIDLQKGLLQEHVHVRIRPLRQVTRIQGWQWAFGHADACERPYQQTHSRGGEQKTSLRASHGFSGQTAATSHSDRVGRGQGTEKQRCRLRR